MDYLYKRYRCSKETLKDTLNKYGVAIIPNVLNENECRDMVSGQWDFFEHITQKWQVPIDRNNDKTYIYKVAFINK